MSVAQAPSRVPLLFVSYAAGAILQLYPAADVPHGLLLLPAILPLLAYLVVRHLEGSLGSMAFAILLGLALAAQFGVFPEVFASATLMGALAAVAGIVFAHAEWRRPILRTLAAAASGYAIAGALLSIYLVTMAVYPRPAKARVPVSDLTHAARDWTTTKALVEPGSGSAWRR